MKRSFESLSGFSSSTSPPPNTTTSPALSILRGGFALHPSGPLLCSTLDSSSQHNENNNSPTGGDQPASSSSKIGAISCLDVFDPQCVGTTCVVVGGGSDGDGWVWIVRSDGNNNEPAARLTGHTSGINDVKFSDRLRYIEGDPPGENPPSGYYAVSGSDDKTLKVRG